MSFRCGYQPPTEEELDMIEAVEGPEAAKKARLEQQGFQAETAGRALAGNIQHLHAPVYQQPWQQLQDRCQMPPPQVPLRCLVKNEARSPVPSWQPEPSVAPVSAGPLSQHRGHVPKTPAYPVTDVPRHALEVSLSEVEDLPCSQEKFAA